MNRAYVIETERLIIRCYKESDANTFNELIANNINHLLPFMPWAKEPQKSLEERITFLRKWIESFNKNDNYMYGAFLKSGAFIGSTGLDTRQGQGILEIGYWLGKEYIKKGYATEISYALTKVAFQHINIGKVEIRNDVLNYASERIPQKLNFKKEKTISLESKHEDGSFIQHAVWSMQKQNFSEVKLYEPIKMFDALDRPLKF